MAEERASLARRSKATYRPLGIRVCRSSVQSRQLQKVSRFCQLPLLFGLALACSSCLFGRIVYYNKPTLAIVRDFDNRRVRASSAPVPLARSGKEAQFPLTGAEQAEYGSLEALLAAHETRAFLVIVDDHVVYERYFDGVSARTLLPGFSMSKTFAAALIGRAVSQGLIESLDQPVTEYIPELISEPGYPEVTLEQLLSMTSGIDFDEESLAGAKFYYSTDLRDQMYSYDVKWRPGSHYLYGSVNIQLLWDVLHRRLAGETVTPLLRTRDLAATRRRKVGFVVTR